MSEMIEERGIAIIVYDPKEVKLFSESLFRIEFAVMGFPTRIYRFFAFLLFSFYLGIRC